MLNRNSSRQVLCLLIAYLCLAGASLKANETTFTFDFEDAGLKTQNHYLSQGLTTDRMGVAEGTGILSGKAFVHDHHRSSPNPANAGHLDFTTPVKRIQFTYYARYSRTQRNSLARITLKRNGQSVYWGYFQTNTGGANYFEFDAEPGQEFDQVAVYIRDDESCSTGEPTGTERFEVIDDIQVTYTVAPQKTGDPIPTAPSAAGAQWTAPGTSRDNGGSLASKPLGVLPDKKEENE